MGRPPRGERPSKLPVMSTDAQHPHHPGGDAHCGGRDPFPLAGRTVLVTGVSRRIGIGHAIACRAADYGASIVAHHYRPHDASQPWGADDIEAVMASIRSHLVGPAHRHPRRPDLPRGAHPRRRAGHGCRGPSRCPRVQSGHEQS
ncbi:hypothetical protein HMPREF1549_01667 [Actinomyces johnsonii F0510]|uniref:SDR family NAD(P)-dependent oxidoreductase n=1 Tax=Actinomyces johnsonii F0510 TaxID=1227262 RepID=U1Q7M2_9ACTO|nr:hypothetical protein HMPREF1549_01667 [Actinomyces johnsonii F0510]